ncbi:MAG: hypothetical protein MUC95_06770, partial [Spirochaetes bacterium]|nr:hypothetical protein [Spirochaetota bacterium]
MKKYIIIIFMIICGLQQAVSGAVLYDPDLEWKSIKAEHFWIHYHQGLDGVAAKMSVIAEKVHKKLVPMIKWAPALRTDIVLIDNMYTANGFATPIPYNKIQIFITRPEPDSILGNFDDWLEFAFTHEYTHILNLDAATGFPGGIRRALGRCCFPNFFVPVWMTEGTAVYHESQDTLFGRNNSTYTDMIFRTELQKNRFKSIAEASTYPRRWPNGNVPYLYGGLFIDYLEKKYGKGTMSNIFIENSDNLIPFEDFCIILPFPCMENRKCDRAVLNDSFVEVWDEWEEFLKIKYTRQIENIRKEEVTKFTKITGSGFNTANPRFSRDGNSVFYTRLTNYNKPALMRYYIPLNESDVLCRVNDPGSISVTDNGMLYISDAEFYKSFSIYNDAYIYDGEYRKLTSKLRSGYIDITPDGKNAVFIKNIGGRYSMILTDKLFMEYRNLIADSDIQLSFTKFSPEGNRIVFSLKDKKGNTDIAILDILKNEIKRLTDDSYNDIEPAWHPDGKHIIFTSDRNGVYNLHEYELTKNTISRITNIIGGA